MSNWKRAAALRYTRWAAGLLVCLGAGALSAIAVSTSTGQTSAAYYYYCPGGGAGGNYGYCPPTTTQTNRPPSCGPINAPLTPVAVGTLVTATAPFIDPDTEDTHTAQMAWGDGTSSAATVTETNGSGTATATHTYTSPGVYILTLTVTDDEGASGTCTFEFLVVFDPSGGFVTGGGWIDSPEGAYTADPTLSGRATFGFVSKYHKGSSVPTGSTEFQFTVGDLNFKSTSYDWLVIAGARAQYKGSGTINGSGDYAFILTAIDGQQAGGGGVDRFRIKIWDKVTGDVIYDNQPGAADSASPTTALGQGSITIHK